MREIGHAEGCGSSNKRRGWGGGGGIKEIRNPVKFDAGYSHPPALSLPSDALQSLSFVLLARRFLTISYNRNNNQFLLTTLQRGDHLLVIIKGRFDFHPESIQTLNDAAAAAAVGPRQTRNGFTNPTTTSLERDRTLFR